MNQHNISDEQQIRTMMLKNIIEMGRFSYSMEEKREDGIFNQSSRMLTAISIFFATEFVCLRILLDYTSLPPSRLLLISAVIASCLLASLLLVLLSQWRFRFQTMANIDKLYDAIEADQESYLSDDGFYLQWKQQLSKLQADKIKINDRRVCLVKAAMILFMLALLTVPLGALLLTLNQ